MKKLVCVLLALAGGVTCFAADGNSGKETVIPYYDPTLPLSHAQKCPKPQLTQGFFGYLPSVY